MTASTSSRRGSVCRRPRPPRRGRAPAHRCTAPTSTTCRCPGMLHACFVRSPFARATIRGIDTSAALGMPRGALRVHGRGPEPGRQGAVAHVDRRGQSGDAAPAARRRRGPLRRRSGRARRRREPRARRGRGRAGRGRLRALARRRRLHRGRALRRARPREPRLQRHRRDRRSARRRARGRVRRGRARRERDDLPAGVRAGADGRARARRRLRARDGRADDLRGDAVAARGPDVLLPPARDARASHPRRDARHRRRVRPEGHGPARRDVPDARRTQGRCAAEVGGGPPREPARGRTSPVTSTPP